MTVSESGLVEFTPAQDFVGFNTFTVQLTDGVVVVEPEVSVEVTNVNDAPEVSVVVMRVDD